MFSFIYNFLRTGICIFFINNFLKHNYHEQYNAFFINMSFNAIYLYGKGQLIYCKYYKEMSRLVNSNTILKFIATKLIKNKNKNNSICQYKDRQIVIKYLDNDTNFINDTNNDSIYIYSDNEKASNNKYVNKVISHSPVIPPSYEVSNIKFMMFEVKMDDGKAYKIDLRSEESNYYIVDNIIDKNFLDYYLMNYYHNKGVLADKYNVKLIDHNVNMKDIEITNDKFIVIKKDDYGY